jgi:hypothetical protein
VAANPGGKAEGGGGACDTRFILYPQQGQQNKFCRRLKQTYTIMMRGICVCCAGLLLFPDCRGLMFHCCIAFLLLKGATPVRPIIRAGKDDAMENCRWAQKNILIYVSKEVYKKVRSGITTADSNIFFLSISILTST